MKDFIGWHEFKWKIDRGSVELVFHEGEIWWCALGLNVGIERDGKNELFERPVLIFRVLNKDMFWGLPLSSKSKRAIYNHIICFHNRQQAVSLSQIRALSGKRLIRRMGKISDVELVNITEAFCIFGRLKTDPLRGPRMPFGDNTNIINDG